MTAVTGDPKRCLLILPRGFYGFAKVLASALQRRGYEVTTANDEYPESVFGKVISKLGLPLSHWITARELTRRCLVGQRYALIVLIKGRGLDKHMVRRLRHHADRVVGYHFDSFRFDRGPARWRAELPRVCSFDYRDAEENELELVELFSSMPAIEDGPRPYRVSAVLRNHSERLVYLDRVMTALGDVPAFIYIYEAHWFSFLANFVRHPRLYLKYRRFISRQPLPYERYVAAIAGSELTIDYAHPRQTGITIRCFEALSAGTRVVTNNPHVLQSPCFTADHAIVFRQGDPVASLRARVRTLPATPPVARRRSVDDFIADLIDGSASPGRVQPRRTVGTQSHDSLNP